MTFKERKELEARLAAREAQQQVERSVHKVGRLVWNITAIIAAIAFFASWPYVIVDTTERLVATLVAGAVAAALAIVAYSSFAKKKLGAVPRSSDFVARYFFIGLSQFFLMTMLLGPLNVWLDGSPSEEQELEYVALRSLYSQWSYQLAFRTWRDENEFVVFGVSQDRARRMSRGERVRVEAHPGFFGWVWFKKPRIE